MTSKWKESFRRGVVALTIACAWARIDSAEGGSFHMKQTGDWTVLAEQDPRALVAQVKVIVRSGSLSDPAGSPGLAHFTARSLLRGTRTRPYKELTEQIERLGASFHVRVDQTQTVFEAAVLAKNLDAFLDLLRDVLTQPAFDPRELATLQKLVQGELRSSLQDVQSVAARATLAAAYPGQLAMQAPQGTVDSVGRLTPLDAQAFFASRYVRQNLVIAVVSPLSPTAARARIDARLHSIPAGALDAPRLPAYSPTSRRAILVSRKNLATIPLYVAAPGVGDGDVDLPALEVGNFVFGADFTSRLTQVLRVEHGWTYYAGSSYRQLVGAKPDSEFFSLYTYPSVEFAEPAILKAVEMLESYASQGLEQDELTRAVQALTRRYAFSLDSAEKRLALKLREVLHGRKLETPAEFTKRLSSLDVASVNDLIRRRTPTANLLVVAVGDPAVLEPVLKSIPGVSQVERLDVKP